VDRIVGLEMVPTNYCQTFNPRELVARINAVLRRRAAPLPRRAGGRTGKGQLREHDDQPRRRARWSATAIDVAHHGRIRLAQGPGHEPEDALSRDKLIGARAGREYEVFDRSIDVQVSRLRKLVEKDPAHPAYIQTVWGSATSSCPTPGAMRAMAWCRVRSCGVPLSCRALVWRPRRLFGIFAPMARAARAADLAELRRIVNLTRTALVTRSPNGSMSCFGAFGARRIQVYPSEPGESLARPPTGRWCDWSPR